MNYLGVLTLPDFVESFPKIIEAAYPLKTVKLLHHHSHKLNSKKRSLLTVTILEFGSIAWMHPSLQNKTFQVYLSGTAEKTTHAAKLFELDMHDSEQVPRKQFYSYK